MKSTSPRALLSLAIFSALLLPRPSAGQSRATPEEAKAFVAKVNDELKRLQIRQQTADWIKSTYITDDTERNAAAANEDLMAYLSSAIKEAMRFDGLDLDPDTRRMLYLLRVSSPLPAPSDSAKRQELAAIAAKLEGLYGKGKWCGKDGKGKCRDLQDLEDLLRKSRKEAELLEAWTGWHSISTQMKPLYERLVALSNEGAREIGYSDLGELWRTGYDMSPADFEKETDRLWEQVKPLYDDLHCYVRARLVEAYGKDKVPPEGPIPAHLLGNMWAQEWENIYPLVQPYPDRAGFDLDAALKSQKYDAIRLVKLGESFFTSLGLDPLPKSFWERSMFVKPRDREVVCHASAWDVSIDDDLRVKMCIRVNEEDLITVHHELGHDYYFHAYHRLPVLYQSGANDGFHEAIGDALTLSITPGYFQQVGLMPAQGEEPGTERGARRTIRGTRGEAAPKSRSATALAGEPEALKEQRLINAQMKDALEKIAFLPFGKLIDQWRWDVFSGKVKPDAYNAAWWALRRKYQGIDAPSARSEADFDPGAKYHIPANVPYTRYFLARILQFQFHRALCQAAGYKGPLHECSIFGNKEAGQKLEAMLAMGASKPWPEALYALTGQREMDASAILDYFAPLRKWLQEQNRGRKCGW